MTPYQLRDTQAEWEGKCKKAEAERKAALSLVSEASQIQRYLETEVADAAGELSKEALQQLRDTQAEWEERCKTEVSDAVAASELSKEALKQLRDTQAEWEERCKKAEDERKAALILVSELQDHNSQLQDHNSETKTAAFAAEQRAEAVLEGVRAQFDDLAQKLRDMQLERDNTFGQSQQYLGQQQEMRHQIEDLKDKTHTQQTPSIFFSAYLRSVKGFLGSSCWCAPLAGSASARHLGGAA